MSVRTNPDLVKSVLLADYDSVGHPSLLPFITAANRLVTRVSTCATNKNMSLSTGLLTDIETWLAAHFYVMSDRAFSEEKSLSASGKYQGQTGKGLEASSYGQTAMILDYSGCLSAIDKNKIVSVKWLGKKSSEQTPLEDRD